MNLGDDDGAHARTSIHGAWRGTLKRHKVIGVRTSLIDVANGFAFQGGAVGFMSAVVSEHVVYRRAEIDGLADIAQAKPDEASRISAQRAKVRILIKHHITTSG